MAVPQQPFTDLEDARRFLEQRIYDHFRETSEWPRARDLDLDYFQLLDPLGGLEVVCRQIGSDRISWGTPTSESDRISLRLIALADCDGAETDVGNFLAAVQLAAKRYHSTRGKDAVLTNSDLVEELHIDEPAARRVIELILSDGGVSAGGGSGRVGLNLLATRMRDVATLDDYLARVAADGERRLALAQAAAGRLGRPAPRPLRRIFLSHAAADGSLALHLKNVLVQGSPELHVFVASKAGDIPTGEDWLDVIEQELKGADAYLLLLTPFSVERFWLWYESGAAWMANRPLIPVTAAGLAKGKVPYPLGARQALALDEPGDVEQLARDLGVTIPDPARFCETVRDLSQALSHADASAFEGAALGDRFFAWTGPLHKLQELTPVPDPPGISEALRAVGATPSFARADRLRQSLAKGLVPVYETDKKTWKREVLYSADGDQHLLVRPPQASS